MNRRLAFATAAYLGFWTVVAGGIIYGVVQTGYSSWVGVVSAFLLFVFVNGSLAYRARVRQLTLEGKGPPSYLRYLLFPQGYPKFKEPAPRFEHFLVGTAALLIGLFLLFCGVALAFDAEWSRISQPILVASICAIIAGIGALFLYFAWRCFGFKRKQSTNVA
jgi:hypothetical protein